VRSSRIITPIKPYSRTQLELLQNVTLMELALFNHTHGDSGNGVVENTVQEPTVQNRATGQHPVRRVTARRCRSVPRPTLPWAVPVPHPPAAWAAVAMMACGLASCAPSYGRRCLRTVAAGAREHCVGSKEHRCCCRSARLRSSKVPPAQAPRGRSWRVLRRRTCGSRRRRACDHARTRPSPRRRCRRRACPSKRPQSARPH